MRPAISVIYARSFSLITQLHVDDDQIERRLDRLGWSRVNRTYTHPTRPVVIRRQRRNLWRIAWRFRGPPPINGLKDLARTICKTEPGKMTIRPVALRMPVRLLRRGIKLPEAGKCVHAYPEDGPELAEVGGMPAPLSITVSRQTHTRCYADLIVGGELRTFDGQPRRAIFLSDHPRPGVFGSDVTLAAQLVLELWQWVESLHDHGVRLSDDRAKRFGQLARVHCVQGQVAFELRLPGVDGLRRFALSKGGIILPVGAGGLGPALARLDEMTGLPIRRKGHGG